MPPDANTLTWLDKQLRSTRGTPWRLGSYHANVRDQRLQYWKAHPEYIDSWRTDVAEETEDKTALGRILSLTNEELLTHARESYDQFLERAVQEFNSNRSYVEKCMGFKRLIDVVQDKSGKGDPVVFLEEYARSVLGYYRLHMLNTFYHNAIGASIRIYEVRAATGQLPALLPDDVPEDPYTGKELGYERTEDGFVLRSGVKPLDQSTAVECRFAVRHQGEDAKQGEGDSHVF